MATDFDLHRSRLVVTVRWSRLAAWLSAWLCCGSPALADQPLYRWVDDQGQTHYSDAPPIGAGSDRPVEVVPIQSAPTMPSSPEDDRYSITNQLEWMRQERERREAQQREEAAIQLERERIQARVREAEARARAAEAEAERAHAPVYVYPSPRPYHPPPPPPPDDDDQAPPPRKGLSLKPLGSGMR